MKSKVTILEELQNIEGSHVNTGPNSSDGPFGVFSLECVGRILYEQ